MRLKHSKQCQKCICSWLLSWLLLVGHPTTAYAQEDEGSKQGASNSDNEICPNCSESEARYARLIEYRALAEMLKEITKESETVPVETLRFYFKQVGDKAEVDALIGKIQAEVSPEKARNQALADNVSAKNPPRKTPERPKPRFTGLQGLKIGHAQAAVPDIGFKATAVIIAHGRPFTGTVGTKFDHNDQKYEIRAIESVDGIDELSVSIQNTDTGRISVLPWVR